MGYAHGMEAQKITLPRTFRPQISKIVCISGTLLRRKPSLVLLPLHSISIPASLLMGQADGEYAVILPDPLPEVERVMEDGDLLRASFYTSQQEAFAYRSALISGVQLIDVLARSSSYAAGRVSPAEAMSASPTTSAPKTWRRFPSSTASIHTKTTRTIFSKQRIPPASTE